MKAIAVCCYIGLLYWISGNQEGMHMLFFPTIGAFGYLFVTRAMSALAGLIATVGCAHRLAQWAERRTKAQGLEGATLPRR